MTGKIQELRMFVGFDLAKGEDSACESVFRILPDGRIELIGHFVHRRTIDLEIDDYRVVE